MLILTSQTAHGFQLSEFRDHVGIGYTDDDPALQRSLDAAVVHWEKATRHYVRDTSFTFDWWQTLTYLDVGGGSITLSAVSRLSNDGTTSTTVTDDWFLTRLHGGYAVQLVMGANFRNDERYTGTFSITADAVDPNVKAAIYALGHHFFTYRQAGEEVAVQTVPFAVRAIIGMYSRGFM